MSDWQTTTTILIILLAVWRVWGEIWTLFAAKDESHCGGCHACPSGEQTHLSQQLVTLDFDSASRSEKTR